MPAGVACPRPVLLTGNGSENLLSAVMSRPTDPSWVIRGIAQAAAKSAPINPPLAIVHRPGWRAGAEDFVIFDRIHLFPRSMDFGVALSEQQVSAEVWNAFRAQSQVLTKIQVDGSRGIQVVDPYGQPVEFPATESKIYLVKALASGDPRINDTVTWVFESTGIAGNDLTLTGFRILPWPFPANMEQPIELEYGYVTSLFTAHERTEQRIGLRALPSGSVSFSCMLGNAREIDFANALLYGGQSRSWGVPFWQWSSRLMAPAASGQKNLSLDTSLGRFIPGGLVFIWNDSFTWEVQRIDSITTSGITLTLNLAAAWQAGRTFIMPLGIGRLSTREIINLEALAAGSTRFTFQIEAFDA